MTEIVGGGSLPASRMSTNGMSTRTANADAKTQPPVSQQATAFNDFGSREATGVQKQSIYQGAVPHVLRSG